MAPVALYPSRYGAPEARMGVPSIDFDGRLTDRSAVAFGTETEACEDMPAEQRVFCLAILTLLAIPYVFIGAAVRWLVG